MTGPGAVGGRPRHTPVQPATDDSFYDTAPHQVWALDRDTRQWLYLPDGAADLRTDPTRPDSPTWKTRCRNGELLCPYPACAAPFATARASQGRHHFAHARGGPSHAGAAAAETWWHLNAKQTMAAWARTTFPAAEVRVDDLQLVFGDQRRQPDVLVTLPEGKRLAVELQFSTLAEPEWSARHSFYRKNGIVDVWLFAHTGPQFQKVPSKGGPLRVRLLPVHQAMVRVGVVPLWFNPVWSRIATAHSPRRPPLFNVPGRPQTTRVYDLPPAKGFTDCQIRIDALDQCAVDWQAAELVTPTRGRQRAGQQKLDEETAAAEAAEQAKLAAAEQAKLAAATAAAAAITDRRPRPSPRPAPPPVAAKVAQPAAAPLPPVGHVPSVGTPRLVDPPEPARVRPVAAGQPVAPSPTENDQPPTGWWQRLVGLFGRR